MKTIHAVYENGVFRPVNTVDLPEHCEVEIVIRASRAKTEQSTLVKLAEISRRFSDEENLPSDLAEQHDHYLYGTPKHP